MRFPHLGEKVFECLDNETLVICKSVGRTFNVFLDKEKIFWIRSLQRIIDNLKGKESKQNIWREFYGCSESINPMLQKEYCVEKQLKGLSASSIKSMAQEATKNSLFKKQFYHLLHLAIFVGNEEIYRSVYANSKDKNPEPGSRVTLLHLAAKHGNLDICRFIIGKVEDKNPANAFPGNDTPLHFAAEHGHLSVYKLLSEHVVDKNPKNLVDDTPLHEAARNGHLAICEFILKNVNAEEAINAKGAGNTPLHYACRKGGHVSLCKNQYGARRDAELCRLCYKQTSVCKFLVENGANTSLTDFWGQTPLEQAKDAQRFDLVQYLESIQILNQKN